MNTANNMIYFTIIIQIGTESRNQADLVLADQARERVKSWDASIGERAAAYAVMNAMKAKAKIGMGNKKSKNNKNGQL